MQPFRQRLYQLPPAPAMSVSEPGMAGVLTPSMSTEDCPLDLSRSVNSVSSPGAHQSHHQPTKFAGPNRTYHASGQICPKNAHTRGDHPVAQDSHSSQINQGRNFFSSPEHASRPHSIAPPVPSVIVSLSSPSSISSRDQNSPWCSPKPTSGSDPETRATMSPNEFAHRQVESASPCSTTTAQDKFCTAQLRQVSVIVAPQKRSHSEEVEPKKLKEDNSQPMELNQNGEESQLNSERPAKRHSSEDCQDQLPLKIAALEEAPVDDIETKNVQNVCGFCSKVVPERTFFCSVWCQVEKRMANKKQNLNGSRVKLSIQSIDMWCHECSYFYPKQAFVRKHKKETCQVLQKWVASGNCPSSLLITINEEYVRPPPLVKLKKKIILKNETLKKPQPSRICEFCNEDLKTKVKLVSHKSWQRCHKCSIVFNCLTLLEQHIQAGHPEAGTSTPEESPALDSVMCKYCNVSLDSSQILANHQHSKKCSKCSTFLGCCRKLAEHWKLCRGGDKEVGSTWLCDFCGKSVKDNMRKVHQTLSNCVNCHLTLPCYGLMEKHQTQCVGRKRSKICTHCRKNLPSSTALMKHTRSKSCPDCSFSATCFTQYKHHKCNKPEGKEKTAPLVIPPPPAPAEKVPVPPQPWKSAEPLKYRCDFCHDILFSEEQLDNHEQPFNCSRCKFVQPCLKLLKDHEAYCRFVPHPTESEAPQEMDILQSGQVSQSNNKESPEPEEAQNQVEEKVLVAKPNPPEEGHSQEVADQDEWEKLEEEEVLRQERTDACDSQADNLPEINQNAVEIFIDLTMDDDDEDSDVQLIE
ncbi:uncharacterized protein LOC132203824 [Neocloeon triangulifer]|uniref:uncharacterized protein LOC132203824 n=1 Tax=Neocloeon triangulifer TaxID=2078957 RepID=UPI00286F68D9|nr:uncharacterized protein LOC132203824 [Neocloeon triangulifer]